MPTLRHTNACDDQNGQRSKASARKRKLLSVFAASHSNKANFKLKMRCRIYPAAGVEEAGLGTVPNVAYSQANYSSERWGRWGGEVQKGAQKSFQDEVP